METVHLLIKPASGSCNLRCSYCFYADEMEKREVASYGKMSEETLEAIVRRVYAEAECACTFAFQGGEPTLAGLPFFERFVALVARYNLKKIETSFALQTNGTLLDEAWAAFFAQHHFLIGLSVDGYRALHDLYRVDAAGRGSFDAALRAAKLLRAHGVEFNLLTVVTAQTAKHIEKLYGFFARQGFRYQQYIPCLDPLGAPRGQERYSLTPALYETFLKKLFDLWYRDVEAGKQPYHRYFENLLGMLLGQLPEACGMMGRCARQLVIEADGSVYPCDFYVLDALCLGNLTTDSFAVLEQRRDALGFLEESAQVAPECRECRWFALCRGGCRRDRDFGGQLLRNYYCTAYAGFFDYAYPRLAALAQQLRR